LDEHRKIDLIERLAELESRLLTVQFSSYGNLYFATDVEKTLSAPRLYNKLSPDDSQYSIGPKTEREFWENGRSGDRGPCIILQPDFLTEGSSVEEYWTSICQREIEWIQRYAIVTRKPCLPHSTDAPRLPPYLNRLRRPLWPRFGTPTLISRSMLS